MVDRNFDPRTILTFLALAMLCFQVSLTSCFAQEDQDQANWVDLFDGENLSGWTQKNGTATFEVEEGSVICGTTSEGSPNSFLCTDKDYGDFILRFEVKVDDELNSGVQIRSIATESEEGAKVKFGRVNGPQVEIEASKANGAFAAYVYGEAAGGWVTPDKQRKAHKIFRNGEWNRYEVIAKGARIQTFLNGEAVGDVTHEEIFESHPAGFIGLQVHSIPRGKGPFQVRWRNLQIRELDADIED